MAETEEWYANLRVTVDWVHNPAPQHIANGHRPAISGQRAPVARVFALQVCQRRVSGTEALMHNSHGLVRERVERVVALGDCGDHLPAGKQGLSVLERL